MSCKKQNMEKLFSNVQESKILDYKFDVKKKQIVFELERLNGGQISKHSVTIDDVYSFYYLDDLDVLYDDDSYLELTSICLDNADIEIKGSYFDWLKCYNSQIKICIEIWGQMLLIGGKKIVVDNKIIQIE